jgi:hypothetical protein
MLLHDASQASTRSLTALLLALLALLWNVFLPARAWADAPRPKGLQLVLADTTQEQLSSFAAVNKYALVVGINEYQNQKQGITSLRFAVGDAKAIYQALVDPQRGDFNPDNVTLLTDDSPQKPTSTAIGKALNRLVTATSEGDLVLIFFSGHGYEEEGRAYLLPANADLDALDYSAIERDAFVRQIDRIPARKVIVILDACHSGGVNRGGKGAGKDAALSAKYYEDFTGSQGRAFIASSGGGELSWEDDVRGHGVFTSSLVDGLSGQADIQPQDGLVSLSELRGYVEKQVSDWASRRGKSQHPQVSLESAYGDIPLALDYAYLESQSKDLTERRNLASRLRSGLATTEGLRPDEMAAAIDVVSRYGRATPLSETDTQNFEFVRKLVDGAIDLKMYRAGVTCSPSLVTGAQIGLQKKASLLGNRWVLGGIGVAVVGTTLALTSGHKGGGSGKTTDNPLLLGPPDPPGN